MFISLLLVTSKELNDGSTRQDSFTVEPNQVATTNRLTTKDALVFIYLFYLFLPLRLLIAHEIASSFQLHIACRPIDEKSTFDSIDRLGQIK